GRLANLVGNQLEQADTRSWTLLPDRISLLRMQLPPGTHPVQLDIEGEGGARWTQDLGSVQVDPGRLTVVRSRVWAGGDETRWEEEFDPLWVEDEPLADPGWVAVDTASG